MKTYAYTENQGVRVEHEYELDGKTVRSVSFVPADPTNADYAEILDLLKLPEGDPKKPKIAPYVAPAKPPVVNHYSKSRLFSAMTDAEYDQYEVVEAKQPKRERGIFRHATEVSSDDPLYPKFVSLVMGLYGETRGKELLALALMV